MSASLEVILLQVKWHGDRTLLVAIYSIWVILTSLSTVQKRLRGWPLPEIVQPQLFHIPSCRVYVVLYMSILVHAHLDL